MEKYAFIAVQAHVRVGNRDVVPHYWLKIDENWRDKVVYDLLLAVLESKAPSLLPLPTSTDITLHCIKRSEPGHGIPAEDAGKKHDCTAFLDVGIFDVAQMIPTRTFRFSLVIPEEVRPRPVNALNLIFANNRRGNDHLPPEKEKDNLTARDKLWNSIRQYLSDNGAGWSADSANKAGTEFINNLTWALFPLSKSVWKAINDSHNRGAPAPDPSFEVFFGHTTMGHKAYRPPWTRVLEKLGVLFYESDSWIKKGGWPVVGPKIKLLRLLIEKYSERIDSQAERQVAMRSVAEPARTVKNASHVRTLPALPHDKKMPKRLISICAHVSNKEVYVPTHANDFMKGVNRKDRY